MTSDQAGALRQEMDEFRAQANRFGSAADDVSSWNDDVYSSQLKQIFEGDLAQLMNNIDACAQSQAKRAAIYEGFDEKDG